MEIDKATELNNKGAQHFLNGEFEKAETCFLESFELNSGNSSLLNNMGLFYHQQKEYNKAIEFFQKALSIEEKPSYLINAANTLAMMGKFEEAKNQYLLTTKKYPNAIGAWISLARMSTHQNSLKDAKGFWEKVLEIDVKPEYLLSLAKILILEKNFEDALDVLYNASKASTSFEIWFHIGRCEFQLRNHGIAEKAFKKALAENPDHIEIRYYLAINQIAKGETLEGLKQLDFILKLEPNNPLILTEKGVILCGMHRYEEALNLFDKALEIEPSFKKALHYKKLIENQTS